MGQGKQCYQGEDEVKETGIITEPTRERLEGGILFCCLPTLLSSLSNDAEHLFLAKDWVTAGRKERGRGVHSDT